MKAIVFITAIFVFASIEAAEVQFQTSPALVIGEGHGDDPRFYPHYSGNDGDQRGRYMTFTVDGSGFSQDTWVVFRSINPKLRTRIKWFGDRTMPDSLLIPAGWTEVRVFFTVVDDNIVQAPVEKIGMYFDSRSTYNYGNASPKITVKNEDWLWIRSKPGQSNDMVYEWSQNRDVEFDVNVPYKLYDMTNGKSLLKSGTLVIPANGTAQSISLSGISASKDKLAFEFDRPTNDRVDNIHYIVKIQKNHFNLPGRVVQVLPEGYHSSQPVQNTGNTETENSQPVVDATVVVEEDSPQPVEEPEPEPEPVPPPTSSYEVPQKMIDKVRYYYRINVEAGRTGKNWWRVLIAFGVETHETWTAMTAAEVKPKIARWSGWKPIYDELVKVEAAQNYSEPDTSPAPEKRLAAYPNPFNPSTVISYEGTGYTRIDVFSVTGQHIRNLVLDNHSRGHKNVRWDGRDKNGRLVSSGVYLVRNHVTGSILKITLLK